jgi:hypothetical protein
MASSLNWTNYTADAYQAVENSIEPSDSQSSTAWGGPPELPIQQQRYSSTPWSERAASTPAAEPRPQTPELTSRSRTKRSKGKGKAKPQPDSPSRGLTAEDRLHVLRLAIQYGHAYGYGTDKAFWAKVAQLFEEQSGKKHASLARAIGAIVKARRIVLAILEDYGERTEVSSYTKLNTVVAPENPCNCIALRTALHRLRNHSTVVGICIGTPSTGHMDRAS